MWSSGDGGPATLAGLNPSDLALDIWGDLFVCERDNNKIRKVNASGIITTVAGTGANGFYGDGGPGIFAWLKNPTSIAIDMTGNLYIADNGNSRIRKVNNIGIITTIAGGGSNLSDGVPATLASIAGVNSLRIDGAGNIYVACHTLLSNSKVRMINGAGFITTIAGAGVPGFSGDGGHATAAKLNNPVDIAIGSSGDIYIADRDNSRVRKVDASGMISTVLGNGLSSQGYGGDGGNPLLATFNGIASIAKDGAGNLYVADVSNNRVRKINVAGVITTVAGNGVAGYFGDGGPASSAALNQPRGVAVDKFGNLFIAEYGGSRVRKVGPTGIITSIAGGGGLLGDGGPATNALLTPLGVTVDTVGNVYIADVYHKRIRKVDAVSGIIATVAGNGSSSASGDGGLPTAAGLDNPTGVAFDRNGNMYIAGSVIRKINTSGIISSLACAGTSVAVDTMGNIYLASGGPVSRYDIYNYLSVIANSGYAYSVTLDTSGNLYFSSSNNQVKKMCCLSTVIDRPPLFVHASGISTTVCRSSVANSIDTFLKVSDGDAGQTETWTIIEGPEHGTLGGFPGTTTSTGGVIVPSGLTYTPNVGYTGSDYFKIKVSDGEDTAMIQISVNVADTPGIGPIYSASDKVCISATLSMSCYTPGGTWSISNSHATINSGGVVTGVSEGVDTVIYTINTYCGPMLATRAITVNPLPVAAIVSSDPVMCVGDTTTFSAGGAFGTWSATSSKVTVGYNSGFVQARSAGTVSVIFTVTNMCGTDKDTATVEVLPLPDAGNVTGNTTGCPGDILALSSSVAGGTWASSNNAVATVDGAGKVSLISAGTSTITYFVTSSCGIGVTNAIITVPSAPDPGSIAGSTVVCAGAATDLNSTKGGGVWSSSDTATATVDSNGIMKAIRAGTVDISYILTNGCGVAGTSAMMNILPSPTLTPIKGKSVIITGSTVELRGRTPTGTWSCSDSSIATVDPWGVVYGVADGEATITYSETNNYGCTAHRTLQVKVTPQTEIDFYIYPNPASRVLTIGYKKSSVPEADIRIADISGRTVFSGRFAMPSSFGTAQLNISGIPEGVYILSIMTGEGEYIGRLVVAH